MCMKLIGSNASPYVRRIRFLLTDKDYEFMPIQVMSKEGKELLARYSPTQRVPLLVDGDKVVWDSMLITEYLQGNIDFEIKKELVLINEMTDSALQLFQLRLFDTDKNDSGTLSQSNLKRIDAILGYFEKRELKGWGLVEQWLYCSLDWFVFRNVHPWPERFSSLKEFYESSQSRPVVELTRPC